MVCLLQAEVGQVMLQVLWQTMAVYFAIPFLLLGILAPVLPCSRATWGTDTERITTIPLSAKWTLNETH